MNKEDAFKFMDATLENKGFLLAFNNLEKKLHPPIPESRFKKLAAYFYAIGYVVGQKNPEDLATPNAY